MRLNASLLKSTVVAALGGLLFGFDTAVIAGTTHALTDVPSLALAAGLHGRQRAVRHHGRLVVGRHTPATGWAAATACG